MGPDGALVAPLKLRLQKPGVAQSTRSMWTLLLFVPVDTEGGGIGITLRRAVAYITAFPVKPGRHEVVAIDGSRIYARGEVFVEPGKTAEITLRKE